jgi:DNA-binding transcriptional regulator YhcF (GntR family)
MEPLFELPIRLPIRGSHQILRALHQQLRAAIVDGRLRPGLRMPSTRALASSHGVSRNTAVAAYDLLLSEGYVSMRQGSGCYVAQALSRPLPGRVRSGSRNIYGDWTDHRAQNEPEHETQGVQTNPARDAPGRGRFWFGSPRRGGNDGV